MKQNFEDGPVPQPDHLDRAATPAEAILTRRSVRAFLRDSVPRKTVEEIIGIAARAPSGTNIQPWRVHVVMGPTKAALEEALCAAFDDPEQKPDREYEYYPTEWYEPYLSRRRQIGWALYGLLGIGRRDHEAMHRQHRRNYLFFDAPVGLFFTMDRRLQNGSWLDTGMFIENIMIAARGFGLHTCAQGAFTSYHKIVRAHLGLPDGEILICGMALGYEDRSKIENSLQSPREPLESFVTFHDR